MRIKIWEKDDFFQLIGDVRINMDPEVVEFDNATPIPLTWNFDFNRIPCGNITDVRVEDGEITGEVKFFDENLKVAWEDITRDFRIAGYYTSVEKNEHEPRVTKCTLKGASIVLKANMPGWSKEKV